MSSTACQRWSRRRTGDAVFDHPRARGARCAIAVLALVGQVLSISCGPSRGGSGEGGSLANPPSLRLRVIPDSQGRPFLGARVVTGVERDGSIAVADMYEDHLVLLDSTGRATRTVGRSGRGPGEFDYVAAMARVPPGFAVWDMFLGRLGIYDTDWTLLHSIRVPFLGGEQAVPFGDGVAILVVRPTLSVVWTDDLTGEAEPIWRTIELLPILGPPPEVGERRIPVIGGSRDGHLFVGWGLGPYLIHAMDTTGTELFTFGRALDPPPRRETDLKRLEKRRARLGSLGVSPDQSQELYPFNPHYRSIREDPCHRLWVGTYRGRDSATVADVFDRGGRFLDTVSLPGRGSLEEVTRSRAYLVVEGEQDVTGVEVVGLGRYACPPSDTGGL